jgi:uridine kinase
MSSFTQLVNELGFIEQINELSKNQTIFIGVAGGSASGKTTFSKWLMDKLSPLDCGIVLQDSYYKNLKNIVSEATVNFDHPAAIDFELLLNHLEHLKSGKSVNLPIYDFKTNSRLETTELMQPKQIVIVDGILVLQDPGLNSFFDLSFFISTPESLRFSRRLARDVNERGRTEEGVKKQFNEFVKPMHDRFVEPSQVFADYVIPGDIAFVEDSFTTIPSQIVRPQMQL